MKKGSNTSWYLYTKITVIPANWHSQATPVAPTQGQSGQRSFSRVCFGCEASFVENGIIRWLKQRLEWGVGWDVYKVLSSTHSHTWDGSPRRPQCTVSPQSQSSLLLCSFFFLFSHSLTFDMNSTTEFSLTSGDKPSISKPSSIFNLTPWTERNKCLMMGSYTYFYIWQTGMTEL